MALVSTGSTMTISLLDNNGKQGSMSINFPTTAGPATVITAVSTVVPLVAAVTQASITGATASFSFFEDTPTTPGPEAEVERRLMLLGKTANGVPVRFSVPSPSFALENAGTDVVNIAGPVEALRDWLVANAAGSGGSAIAALDRAYVVHRYRKPTR